MSESRGGHQWALIEPGPPGHDPPWGDWYRCMLCGEGTRSATPPPADKLVFDHALTCEKMQAYVRRTLSKLPKGWP